VAHGTKLALEAFALGLALALLLTGPAASVARRLGAVDRPGGRRMHEGVIPLGGGIALLAGSVFPVLLLADHLSHPMRAILAGACLCALVGFADDVYDLPVVVKFAAQIGVAAVPVAAGVSIDHVTLPFLSPFSTGVLQYPLTIIWIVGLMNVLNFVDGMDGLAAGIGAISSGTFCVLALSLGRVQPALVVAALAGACIGFLRRNFHPARVFMGDAGSMTIGFVLASVAVIGVLKTAAAVAVGFPLVVLFVPLLDTSFVIARRLKHGQAPWRADSGHLHHRFARIGWGQRQAALLLYGWCASLAGFALAIRFVHYRTPEGVHWDAVALLAALGLLALAFTVYVVYVLEILKQRHLHLVGLRRGSEVPGETPLVVARRERRERVAAGR
jgi:UDP-GlcNAc:undecaprenyl-phosphate/decaprenyl-phosphate GlcNAc-1-phosphate transferase